MPVDADVNLRHHEAWTQQMNMLYGNGNDYPTCGRTLEDTQTRNIPRLHNKNLYDDAWCHTVQGNDVGSCDTK